ncbi:MAG: efflux RND transporter periplasmic adaptor subunit [Candidatus Aminicenantes bacterium]|nr:efflux RND transporter periplasmic adaptor subunit [Candidatus Aminicenantes bacterium]
MNMNKVFKIIAFVIMIAALAWGGYKLFFQEEKKEATEIIKADENKDAKEGENKEGEGESKETALPVAVLRIKRGDMPMRLPISATADVWEKATLKAEVDGTVEEIRYPIGALVRKDTELVKLDDSEIQLQVDRADADRLQALSKYLVAENTDLQKNVILSNEDKAKLDQLKEKYLAAVKNYEKGKISEKQLDEINDQYEQAMVYAGVLREEIRKAQEGFSDANIRLKQAKLDLKRTSIKSPFQGTIADIVISKGAKVTRGLDLLKIVNLRTLYLKGFALESEVAHLKKGTAVRVKFDSFPDQYYYGQIQSISPEIDPQNKTISIYVDLENTNNSVLPGMHAAIDVEYKIYKDVLRVPRNAIIVRQRPLIFIVNEKDNMAMWEYVELGEKNDEDQVIEKGLNNGVKEGDLVVISGHLTLAHQSKVKILEIIDQK